MLVLSERLIVEGIPDEVRQSLKQSAQTLYGKPNISLLIRHLIAQHLQNRSTDTFDITAEQTRDTVRVELRLPSIAVQRLEEIAHQRLSSRNHYINSIILAHLGAPQLQGDEIEVLRRSNYEISKIGTNLNQIARAFNILVQSQEKIQLPEIGKKIASLRKEISTHTHKVLRVLETGSMLWENTGQSKRKKTKSMRKIK